MFELIALSSALVGSTGIMFISEVRRFCADRPVRLRVAARKSRFERPVHPFTADEPRFEGAW